MKKSEQLRVRAARRLSVSPSAELVCGCLCKLAGQGLIACYSQEEERALGMGGWVL